MTKGTFEKYQAIIDQWFVNGFNGAKAYRSFYPGAKRADDSFSKIQRIPEVEEYIKQKQGVMEKEFMYSLSESVKKDLKLIERYEVALEILENIDASDEEVKVAQRVIRHIGATGYSSAQERLSKQGGFYEKDNTQKQTPIQPLQFRVISKEDNE